MTSNPSRLQQPLLVHLAFHPDSERGREIAERVHDELNTDPVVPGLRVPTTFCPRPAGSPYVPLDQAQRNLVVLLADDDLNNDERWCDFAVDVWRRCGSGDHRFLPVQLDPHAYPLDPQLAGVNFARAHDVPDAVPFVVRNVVIALCRLLRGLAPLAGGSDRVRDAPTKIFLSHTKLDLDRKPRVVRKLAAALGPEQQNRTWFDSGDIDAGSLFAEKIREGIEDSSLLCVLTDHYASREWCRREVLLAKEKRRPIVVVDAVRSHEVRSFPYIGNVPVIRWSGDPRLPIDLLLKETLRQLHAEALLVNEDWDGETLTRPPELITVARMAAGTKILYPDPPLGREELRTLTETSGVVAITPIGRVARQPDLAERRIALSMSRSDDLEVHGFTEVHLRGAMLELARYLLIRGATLVYGGHLRPGESYTLDLIELVKAHNELDDVPPVQRVENLLSWPMVVTKAERSQYKTVAEIVELPRPEGVDERLHPDLIERPPPFSADRSAAHRYAWARAMTEMRRHSASDKTVVARVVMGGPCGPVRTGHEERWYASRIPGVLEEVFLALEAGQPVFLVGAFGGVPAMLFDVISGIDRPEMTWEFQRRAPHAEAMRELYEERGDEWVDYDVLVDRFREVGLVGLNPLLSGAEHIELAKTRDITRMIELILIGLSRVTPSATTHERR